jgi:hypothetical protein
MRGVHSFTFVAFDIFACATIIACDTGAKCGLRLPTPHGGVGIRPVYVVGRISKRSCKTSKTEGKSFKSEDNAPLCKNDRKSYYKRQGRSQHFMLALPVNRRLKRQKGAVIMGKDIFSASEAEFLTFATTFNYGAVAHAELLGIPDTGAGDRVKLSHDSVAGESRCAIVRGNT